VSEEQQGPSAFRLIFAAKGVLAERSCRGPLGVRGGFEAAGGCYGFHWATGRKK